MNDKKSHSADIYIQVKTFITCPEILCIYIKQCESRSEVNSKNMNLL